MDTCKFEERKKCYTEDVNRENCMTCIAVFGVTTLLKASLKNPILAGRIFEDLNIQIDVMHEVYKEYGNVPDMEVVREAKKFLAAGKSGNFDSAKTALQTLKGRLV
jgi:hypothetical protein